MHTQYTKICLGLIMCAVFIVPLLVMLWNVQLGGAFLLLSWPFATRIMQ